VFYIIDIQYFFTPLIGKKPAIFSVPAWRV